MLNKAFALGLLSIAALGVISLPAQADTAVIQEATQDLYIDGWDNDADQVSEQRSSHRSDDADRSRSSIGVVQDAYQGATVYGEDNDAYQENRQINRVRIRRGHDD